MTREGNRRFGWMMIGFGIVNVLFWAMGSHEGRAPNWLDGATLVLFGAGLLIGQRRPARHRRRAGPLQMILALFAVVAFVWAAVTLPVFLTYALAIASICFVGREVILVSRVRGDGRAA